MDKEKNWVFIDQVAGSWIVSKCL